MFSSVYHCAFSTRGLVWCLHHSLAVFLPSNQVTLSRAAPYHGAYWNELWADTHPAGADTLFKGTKLNCWGFAVTGHVYFARDLI